MVEFVEWLGRLEGARVCAISLIVFVAWMVAATGWVRALAVVWLIYPAFCIGRWVYPKVKA
jgi:hypothetical protein